MKAIFKIICGIVFICNTANAQSWQWAKSGGGADGTINGERFEEVQSIVTDSQKNIYILSHITGVGTNVAGNPKQYWGDSTTKIDWVLASFACDGTYRWSKIIGGSNLENVQALQIDSQNNIYFVGKFGGTYNFPARIDDDYIITETIAQDNNSKIFIAKYNSLGQVQWVRRPQADTVPSSIGYSLTGSVGLLTDLLGNSEWFVLLPVGSYANGQFNVTVAGLYVLRYNAAGTFVSGTPYNITFGSYANLYSFKFYRNPVNNNICIMGERYFGANSELSIGGQAVNNSNFLACFNAAGTFLWKRESNSTDELWVRPYGLAFDQDSNIYIGGTFFQYGDTPKNYLGYAPPAFGNRQFIMKLNPDASQVLWSSNSNAGGLEQGGIAYNPFTNQVGLTTWGGGDYTWGNLTVNVNTFGVGGDVVLLRFNKNTGICTNIDKIAANPNYTDNGTALAVDASGDYIVGGGFGSQLFPNASTTLYNIGGQSDFFVAKFATQVCSSLTNQSFEKAELQVYPNPTTALITIGVLDKTTFEIFDIAGKQLLKGKIGRAHV